MKNPLSLAGLDKDARSPQKKTEKFQARKPRDPNKPRRVKKVVWTIQDISHKKTIYDTREALHSPEFTVNLDGRSKILKGAKLVFYPNGATLVTKPGNCSLFLVHPFVGGEGGVVAGGGLTVGGGSFDVDLSLRENMRLYEEGEGSTRHGHRMGAPSALDALGRFRPGPVSDLGEQSAAGTLLGGAAGLAGLCLSGQKKQSFVLGLYVVISWTRETRDREGGLLTGRSRTV